jgi:hypothetical protein
VRIDRAVARPASVAILPDDPTETDLRGGERNADNDDRDHELPVEGWSVIGNRRRQPPFPTEKQEQ